VKSNTPRTDAVFFSFHTHDDLVELSEKLEREVARLRELLEWAETLLCNAEPPKHSDYAEWMGLVHKWRDQKHGLASAPEEPISTPADLNQHNKEGVFSLNDWREPTTNCKQISR